MKRVILAVVIGLAIGFGSVAACKAEEYNVALSHVTSCDDGAMQYNDSGWLEGDEGRVDYHEIVALSPVQAMPDDVWAASLDGHRVFVCRDDIVLRYIASSSMVYAELR